MARRSEAAIDLDCPASIEEWPCFGRIRRHSISVDLTVV